MRELCRSDSIDSIQSKKRSSIMIDGGFNQCLSVEIEGMDYPGWAFPSNKHFQQKKLSVSTSSAHLVFKKGNFQLFRKI